MITVNEIKAYSASLKENIERINFEKTVVDEGQIVRFLKNVTRDENNILLTIIPSVNGHSGDIAHGYQNRMMFFVLQKYDSSITHHEFLDIMQDTQITTQAVIDKLKNDMECCNSFLQFLIWNSLDINPIRSFAECHGWSIEFSFNSY